VTGLGVASPIGVGQLWKAALAGVSDDPVESRASLEQTVHAILRGTNPT
jgi:hypothetical protein